VAIDREAVTAAVGKVLPSASNFARDSRAGESPDEYYAQVSSAVLTALHADPEAVFYLAYLAATRLNSDVAAVLTLTDALLSDGGLRALENAPHARLVSTAGLSAARANLARLDANTVTGNFAVEQVQQFRDAIREYIASAVAPNLRNGGSRTAARVVVQALLPALESGLASLPEGKAAVSSVVSAGAALDLRTLISARVSVACAEVIRQIEAELPAINDERQAARMAGIAAELAATYAAIGSVGNAVSPLGAVVSGPRSDGYTESAFKAAKGLAAVAPPAAILAGFNGRIYVDPLATGTGGLATDDVDGDQTTPQFADASVADWKVLGVEVGHTLFTYATGVGHRIVGLGPPGLDPGDPATFVRVSPEVPLSVTGTKWFVSEEPPGTYFEDPDVAYWQKYEHGQTPSTVLSSGTRGYYPRTIESSGSAATRVIAAGTAGVGDPWFLSGFVPASIQIPGTVFLATGAAFLTSGVQPGWILELGDAPTYTKRAILYALTEEYLALALGAPVNVYPDWRVVRWGTTNDQVLEEAGANFIGRGVEVGMRVDIYISGSNAGTYTITEVLSDDAIRLDAPLVHETGMGWRILLPDDELIDAAATFLSYGIGPGTLLHVGAVTYSVDAVISQTRLRLSGTWAQTDFINGDAWLVYRSETATAVFRQADGTDLSSTPPVVNGYPVTLTVGGVVRPFKGPLAGDVAAMTLRAQVAYYDVPDLAWSLLAGDWTDRLSDTVDSPFGDLAPGTTLVLWPGAPTERKVQILEVYGSSSVRVSGPIPQGMTEVPYAVYSPVYPRHELLYEGARYPISSIVNGRLRLSKLLPAASGVGLTYFVVEPTSVTTSNLLSDEAGALAYDPAGFGAELVGTLLKVNSTPVYKVTITGVADLDNDAVNETLVTKQQFLSGRSKVPYEVWAEIEGRTTSLRFPGAAVGAQAGDYAALWSFPAVQTVVSETAGSGFTEVVLSGVIPAGIEAQLAVVTRGGSPEFARWVLFDSLLTAAPLPGANLTTLGAFVARAFLDGGGAGDVVAAGGVITVRNDGDDDDLTPLLVLDVDVGAGGARYGDLITLTHAGGASSRHYLASVTGAAVSVVPELDVASVVASWTMQRTSISEALFRVYGIDQQLRYLSSLLAAYTVSPSKAVAAALALLVESGLDRAADALRAGSLPGLASLSRSAASYLGNATSAVRSAGGSLDGASRGRVTASSLGSLSGAHAAVARAAEALGVDEGARTVAALSPEDERNRAVFALVGETVTGVVSEQDPTLPWLASTGTKKDRVNRDIEAAKAALQYVVDHPDEFEEV
jgi:hypothetical protein